MAPGKWDDHSEKIMLFAMVTLLKAGKSTSWDNVETMMGGEFKANAIRQRWAKIKKECGENMGVVEDGDGDTPKPKAKKAAGEKSGGKRKGKKDADVGEGEGDDDEEESPTKKVKVEKAEEEEGDDALA